MKTIIFVSFVLSFLGFGYFSLAADNSDSCGLDEICNPLKYKEVDELISALISFIFKIGLAIAPIMFIIAGFLFVASGGDPARVETAKKMILYTLIGFAIILVASGLVKVLQSILGV